MSNNQSNNSLNLLSGAFITAKGGVELPAFPEEGLAVKLMSAKGTQLKDHVLMESKGYYTAVMTTPNGDTCWAKVPVDYPFMKWNNNNCCWVLLQPIPEVMTASQFHAM